MSVYKVGDIAALFPIPKVPQMESGRKLQALFDKFHNKNRGRGLKTTFPNVELKEKPSSPQENMEISRHKPGIQMQAQGNKPNNHVNKRKGKKRKLSSSETPVSSLNYDLNPLKKSKLKSEEISPKPTFDASTEKTENESANEIYFPRRKKIKVRSKFGRTDVIDTQEENSTLKNQKLEDSAEFHAPYNFSNAEMKYKSSNLNKLNKKKNDKNDTFENFADDSTSFTDKSQNNERIKKKAKKKKFYENQTSENNAFEIGCNEKKKQSKNSPVLGKQRLALQKESTDEKVIPAVKNLEQLKVSPLKYFQKEETQTKTLKQKKAKKRQERFSHDTSTNKSDESMEDNVENVNKTQAFKSPQKKEFISLTTEKEKYVNKAGTFKNSKKGMLPNNKDGFIPLPKIRTEETGERLGRTLYVGNLPINVTNKDLKQLFTPFGPVECVRLRGAIPEKQSISKKVAEIKGKYHSILHCRIGYVIFKDRDDAMNALSLNGTLYRNHHILVDAANKKGERKLYDGKRSIFIGNLPFDVEDESVWSAFAQCGRVECVRVIRDRETGAGKGFGYVLFYSEESKEKAFALENVIIGGREVRIKSVESGSNTNRASIQAPNVPQNSYKRKALQIKKNLHSTTSRKSTKKIMKRQKNLHLKKKVASILQNKKQQIKL